VKRLELADLVSIEAYESLRDEYRARIMAHKRNRRMPVGDRVTLLFEDRETMRFQVLEMMRVERIRDPAKLQHELDVYNELVPGEGQLAATLMIEITDLGEIRPALDRLVGLDEHLALLLGEGANTRVVRATFDQKQLEEDRIAAVHYVKFSLSENDVECLRDTATPARIRIDQANYLVEVELPLSTRHSLIEDLAGGGPPLLEVPEGSGVHDTPVRFLFEGKGLRVRRPFHAAGRGHVVVEATAPLSSWLDADPALWSELQAVLRRYGREIETRHGACRCVTDLHAVGARWHLFAPKD